LTRSIGQIEEGVNAENKYFSGKGEMATSGTTDISEMNRHIDYSRDS